MKDKINIKTGVTLPVLGSLGSVLVVLKSLEMIALPWLWVLAPFWFPILAVVIIVIIILIALAIASAVE